MCGMKFVFVGTKSDKVTDIGMIQRVSDDIIRQYKKQEVIQITQLEQQIENINNLEQNSIHNLINLEQYERLVRCRPQLIHETVWLVSGEMKTNIREFKSEFSRICIQHSCIVPPLFDILVKQLHTKSMSGQLKDVLMSTANLCSYIMVTACLSRENAMDLMYFLH